MIQRSLKGAKVLVIGGGGNIGSHIVDALIEEETIVAICDLHTNRKKANLAWAIGRSDIQIIDGDIRDYPLMEEICKGMDYVFHLAAALIRECDEDPELAVKINVNGTNNVLKAAASACIKRFIFASAGAVYGDSVYLPFDEGHPTLPPTVYGKSKVECERLCEEFYQKHSLQYVALRYWNVYGPRSPFKGRFSNVIPRFIELIENGQPLTIHNDGSQTFDFIHAKDVARATLLACKSNVKNDIFNVASGIETSIKELAEILLQLTGAKSEVLFKKNGTSETGRRWACTKKAEEILGFKAAIGLREGLKELIEGKKGLSELNERLVEK